MPKRARHVKGCSCEKGAPAQWCQGKEPKKTRSQKQFPKDEAKDHEELLMEMTFVILTYASGEWYPQAQYGIGTSITGTTKR